MADLTVIVAYTRNGGDLPATGLALADILLYLTSVHRVTGARMVIWNGVNPTFEVNNTGTYGRILTTADLDVNNYVGGGRYTGLVALDNDWVVGSCGITEPPIGTAIAFTYTVTDVGTGLPLEGAEVWISTDAAMNNIVWCGVTDTFGVARDEYDQLPRLDAGTYYFWRQLAGYIFTDPDIENVSP